jgi:hypothetical protein
VILNTCRRIKILIRAWGVNFVWAHLLLLRWLTVTKFNLELETRVPYAVIRCVNTGKEPLLGKIPLIGVLTLGIIRIIIVHFLSAKRSQGISSSAHFGKVVLQQNNWPGRASMG